MTKIDINKEIFVIEKTIFFSLLYSKTTPMINVLENLKAFYASVSLGREHLRGLRENSKHKIQPKESCKRRNSNKGSRIVGGIKARSGKTFALSFYMSKTILGLSKNCFG